MAVTAIPLGTRLTLRLNTGLDENFNPVFRNRSWHNVKSTAVHADLFALGEELASLQLHSLDAIRRVDENDLEEV